MSDKAKFILKTSDLIKNKDNTVIMDGELYEYTINKDGQPEILHHYTDENYTVVADAEIRNKLKSFFDIMLGV